MTKILWRLDGMSQEPNHAGWQQGLSLHLLFQPLTTIIARRDGLTRHYLSLEGCPHCRPDGCERMCHCMLFAQLVSTTLPGVTLTHVARLVPRATETRRAVALPRKDARLLDTDFLAQWPEGRLVTTWSRLQAQARPVHVGALLAVSTEGPSPRQALRAHGWQIDHLAALTHRAAFKAPVPGPVRAGRRADEALLHAFRTPWAVSSSEATDVDATALVALGSGEERGRSQLEPEPASMCDAQFEEAR